MMKDEPIEQVVASIRVKLGRMYEEDLTLQASGEDPNRFSRMISERRSLGYTDYTVTLGSVGKWVELLADIAREENVIAFYPEDARRFKELVAEHLYG